MRQLSSSSSIWRTSTPSSSPSLCITISQLCSSHTATPTTSHRAIRLCSTERDLCVLTFVHHHRDPFDDTHKNNVASSLSYPVTKKRTIPLEVATSGQVTRDALSGSIQRRPVRTHPASGISVEIESLLLTGTIFPEAARSHCRQAPSYRYLPTSRPLTATVLDSAHKFRKTLNPTPRGTPRATVLVTSCS